MEILLKGFKCQRCGHTWKPRKAGTPKKCPACDSSNWQFPRGEGMPPHLEEVFQLYEVPEDQRAEIISYAGQHPGVAQALREAVPHLEKVFGKARRRLDLFQFWDSDDDQELFGQVLVKHYPENTFDLLGRFLEAWLPKVPREVRTKLNFSIEPADDYPV